jgi:hypothetical protein
MRCTLLTTVNVLKNDFLCDTSNYKVVVTSTPQGFAAMMNGKDVDIVNNTGMVGTFVFGYAICDSMKGRCDTANIVMYVPPGEDAVNDRDTLSCAIMKNIYVLSNDFLCLGIAQDSLVVIQQSNKGNAVFLPNNVLQFTKFSNATGGATTLRYAIINKFTNQRDTATINLLVILPIDAVNDNGTIVACDSIVTINVKANDVLCAGILDTLVIVQGSNAGTTSLNGSSVTFKKNTNAPSGNTIVRYALCDKAFTMCDTATITINVQIGRLTTATDVATTSCLDSVLIDVLANDVKTCNGVFDSMSIFIQPINGTASVLNNKVVYKPYLSLSTEDTFTYRVCDSLSRPNRCSNVRVFITNNPLPAHYAVMDTLSIAINSPIAIPVLKNDQLVACKITKSITISKAPLNGTASAQGDSAVLYTPNTSFVGMELFEYQICNNLQTGSVCDKAKIMVGVGINVSITTIENAVVKVFPNPVMNVLQLESTEALDMITIKDMTGKSIYSSTTINSINTIDMSAFEKGSYLLELTKNRMTKTQKLIKE